MESSSNFGYGGHTLREYAIGHGQVGAIAAVTSLITDPVFLTTLQAHPNA